MKLSYEEEALLRSQVIASVKKDKESISIIVSSIIQGIQEQNTKLIQNALNMEVGFSVIFDFLGIKKKISSNYYDLIKRAVITMRALDNQSMLEYLETEIKPRIK